MAMSQPTPHICVAKTMWRHGHAKQQHNNSNRHTSRLQKGNGTPHSARMVESSSDRRRGKSTSCRCRRTGPFCPSSPYAHAPRPCCSGRPVGANPGGARTAGHVGGARLAGAQRCNRQTTLLEMCTAERKAHRTALHTAPHYNRQVENNQSYIQHPTSNTQHPTSNIQHPTHSPQPWHDHHHIQTVIGPHSRG